MIRITRYDKDRLEKAGLLRHKDARRGREQDANYVVANREHCGRDKSYYITEEPRIMAFLGLTTPRKNNHNNRNKNNNYNNNRNNNYNNRNNQNNRPKNGE